MASILNGNLRLRYGGTLDFNFGNFENCLSHNSEVIGSLKDDCVVAFTALNGQDEDDDIASIKSNEYHNSGSTYFQQSNIAPRCCLEELALSIFRFHTKNATFDHACSGAEWWTQVVDEKEDIGFHWDRDYGHEGSTGENLYPHLATVTYLTNRGGPTVILNKVGCPYSQECHSGPASDIIVSKPVLGKHIKFDGRLLHAAPSNLISTVASNESDESREEFQTGHQKANVAENKDDLKNYKRVTFLVNIWLNHIPIQAKSFPSDSLEGFSPHLKGSELSYFDQNHSEIRKLQSTDSTERGGDKALTLSSGKSIDVIKIKVPSTSIKSEIQLGTLNLHRWNFINGGKKYRVCIPLSSTQRLDSLFRKYSAFRFTYSGSSVTANVESLEEKEEKLFRSKKQRKIYWRPTHRGLF